MEGGGSRGGVRRKGAWSKEEDLLLRKCIEKYGEGKWRQVPLQAGLNRCRKSCRLRWLNYLHPNIKRGEFTSDEVDLIIRMHKLLGNRWSLIAGRLPGRTANDIKNYCNTHLTNMLSYRNNNKVVVMTKSFSTHDHHKYLHEILINHHVNKKDQYQSQTSSINNKVLRPLPRTMSKNSKCFKATTTNTNTISSVVAANTNEKIKFTESNIGQTPPWLNRIMQLEVDDQDHYQLESMDGIERSLCALGDKGLMTKNHSSSSSEVQGNRDEDEYWNDLYLDDDLWRLLGEEQEILIA